MREQQVLDGVRAKAVDQEHNDGGTIWILEDVTLSRQNTELSTRVDRDHAESIEANSVHGSDSQDNAKIEIDYFFKPEEIVG